jgi:hypothetical protein
MSDQQSIGNAKSADALFCAYPNISSCLDEMATSFRGGQRRHLLNLSRWFRQSSLQGTSADQPSHRIGELLQRPDGLAICLPLIQAEGLSNADGPTRTRMIREAVTQGCGRIAAWTLRENWLWVSLIYPVVVLYLCGGLTVAFALFLAPEFERMFTEFRVSSSSLTVLVIKTMQFVRHWWIVLVSLSLVPFLMTFFRRPLKSRPAYTWFEGQLSAWAWWAWHVGLLVEAGKSLADAIAIAGNASPQRWLRARSQMWSEQLSYGGEPFNTTIYGRVPLHTLTFALTLTDPNAQSRLLQQVALNYSDRSRNQVRWRLRLLSAGVAFVAATGVGTVFAAMFIPLVNLINQLGGT